MKKKHSILYDSIVQQINRLSDSVIAEAFAEQLEASGAGIDEFVTVTERLRGFGADLVGAKARREHFAYWSDLRLCLEDFAVKFSAFPDLNFVKHRLELMIATKLAQIAPTIDMADIDAFASACSDGEDIDEIIFWLKRRARLRASAT